MDFDEYYDYYSFVKNCKESNTLTIEYVKTFSKNNPRLEVLDSDVNNNVLFYLSELIISAKKDEEKKRNLYAEIMIYILDNILEEDRIKLLEKKDDLSIFFLTYKHQIKYVTKQETIYIYEKIFEVLKDSVETYDYEDQRKYTEEEYFEFKTKIENINKISLIYSEKFRITLSDTVFYKKYKDYLFSNEKFLFDILRLYYFKTNDFKKNIPLIDDIFIILDDMTYIKEDKDKYFKLINYYDNNKDLYCLFLTLNFEKKSQTKIHKYAENITNYFKTNYFYKIINFITSNKEDFLKNLKKINFSNKYYNEKFITENEFFYAKYNYYTNIVEVKDYNKLLLIKNLDLNLIKWFVDNNYKQIHYSEFAVKIISGIENFINKKDYRNIFFIICDYILNNTYDTLDTSYENLEEIFLYFLANDSLTFNYNLITLNYSTAFDFKKIPFNGGELEENNILTIYYKLPNKYEHIKLKIENIFLNKDIKIQKQLYDSINYYTKKYAIKEINEKGNNFLMEIIELFIKLPYNSNQISNLIKLLKLNFNLNLINKDNNNIINLLYLYRKKIEENTNDAIIIDKKLIINIINNENFKILLLTNFKIMNKNYIRDILLKYNIEKSPILLLDLLFDIDYIEKKFKKYSVDRTQTLGELLFSFNGAIQTQLNTLYENEIEHEKLYEIFINDAEIFHKYLDIYLYIQNILLKNSIEIYFQKLFYFSEKEETILKSYYNNFTENFSKIIIIIKNRLKEFLLNPKINIYSFDNDLTVYIKLFIINDTELINILNQQERWDKEYVNDYSLKTENNSFLLLRDSSFIYLLFTKLNEEYMELNKKYTFENINYSNNLYDYILNYFINCYPILNSINKIINTYVNSNNILIDFTKKINGNSIFLNTVITESKTNELLTKVNVNYGYIDTALNIVKYYSRKSLSVLGINLDLFKHSQIYRKVLKYFFKKYKIKYNINNIEDLTTCFKKFDNDYFFDILSKNILEKKMDLSLNPDVKNVCNTFNFNFDDNDYINLYIKNKGNSVKSVENFRKDYTYKFIHDKSYDCLEKINFNYLDYTDIVPFNNNVFLSVLKYLNLTENIFDCEGCVQYEKVEEKIIKPKYGNEYTPPINYIIITLSKDAKTQIKKLTN